LTTTPHLGLRSCVSAQREWAIYATNLDAELRVQVDEDDAGARAGGARAGASEQLPSVPRPRGERVVMNKACNLTFIPAEDDHEGRCIASQPQSRLPHQSLISVILSCPTADAALLEPAEKARWVESGAEVCYLAESDVEVGTTGGQAAGITPIPWSSCYPGAGGD
jgi:hypothetical protein